ncbi:hypothetical protein B0H14DRAFT_3472646 [Mycena olivaceomarginata]|nr:hypothetical protein B0H14DRAFT_3472646 [Mycena olivaceomarginata]
MSLVTANGNLCPLCGNQLAVKVTAGRQMPGSKFLLYKPAQHWAAIFPLLSNYLSAGNDSQLVSHRGFSTVPWIYQLHEEWTTSTVSARQKLNNYQPLVDAARALRERELDQLPGVRSLTPEAKSTISALPIPLLSQPLSNLPDFPTSLRPSIARLWSLSPSPGASSPLFPPPLLLATLPTPTATGCKRKLHQITRQLNDDWMGTSTRTVVSPLLKHFILVFWYKENTPHCVYWIDSVHTWPQWRDSERATHRSSPHGPCEPSARVTGRARTYTTDLPKRDSTLPEAASERDQRSPPPSALSPLPFDLTPAPSSPGYDRSPRSGTLDVQRNISKNPVLPIPHGLRSSLLGVQQQDTTGPLPWRTYRVPDADPSDKAEDILTQLVPHFTRHID